MDKDLENKTPTALGEQGARRQAMVLFIGGCADGERKFVSPLLQQVRIPKPRPAAFFDKAEIAVSLEHETYRRSLLGCDDKRYTIFILNSLPECAVIERLIAGYKAVSLSPGMKNTSANSVSNP